MTDDRKKRAQNVLDGLAEYASIHGDRFVCYMLDKQHPFPAPVLTDHTVWSDNVMVILPDENLDRKTEDML